MSRQSCLETLKESFDKANLSNEERLTIINAGCVLMDENEYECLETAILRVSEIYAQCRLVDSGD